MKQNVKVQGRMQPENILICGRGGGLWQPTGLLFQGSNKAALVSQHNVFTQRRSIFPHPSGDQVCLQISRFSQSEDLSGAM